MGVEIEIILETDAWEKHPGIEALIQKALQATANDFALANAEFSVLLTGDEQIRKLNKKWRGFDKATNVLSFPASAIGQPDRGFLGDIVLAHETAAREAAEENKDFLHHAAHLAVHGALHLLGLDHQDDAGAEAMEDRERKILAKLGIPDPYASSNRKLTEPA